MPQTDSRCRSVPAYLTALSSGVSAAARASRAAEGRPPHEPDGPLRARAPYGVHTAHSQCTMPTAAAERDDLIGRRRAPVDLSLPCTAPNNATRRLVPPLRTWDRLARRSPPRNAPRDSPAGIYRRQRIRYIIMKTTQPTVTSRPKQLPDS